MPEVTLTEGQIKVVIKALNSADLNKKECAIRDRALKVLQPDVVVAPSNGYKSEAPKSDVDLSKVKLTQVQLAILRRLIDHKGRATANDLLTSYTGIAPLIVDKLVFVDSSNGTPYYNVTDAGREFNKKVQK